jgi:hypothetical protein
MAEPPYPLSSSSILVLAFLYDKKQFHTTPTLEENGT